jgi:hypothetical protein
VEGPAETRRESVLGGSARASLRATVSAEPSTRESSRQTSSHHRVSLPRHVGQHKDIAHTLIVRVERCRTSVLGRRFSMGG